MAQFIGKIEKNVTNVSLNEEKKAKSMQITRMIIIMSLQSEKIQTIIMKYIYMRQGLVCHYQQEFSQASDFYGKCIIINPNDPNCWFKKGNCLSNLKKKMKLFLLLKK